MSLAHRMKMALGEHNFFGLRWIIEKFNDFDVLRAREIGPDRIAAEWLLRCGGSVKFDRYPGIIEDYNSLVKKTAIIDPAKPDQQVYVTHAHALNACITARGCRHFEGLTRLEEIRFVHCKNLEDEGLKTISEKVGSIVRSIEISGCRYITDGGVKELAACSKLESLVLCDLKRVKKPILLYDYLKERLPSDCEVFFDQVKEAN